MLREYSRFRVVASNNAVRDLRFEMILKFVIFEVSAKSRSRWSRVNLFFFCFFINSHIWTIKEVYNEPKSMEWNRKTLKMCLLTRVMSASSLHRCTRSVVPNRHCFARIRYLQVHYRSHRHEKFRIARKRVFRNTRNVHLLRKFRNYCSMRSR